jgi:hypothetical protein
MNTQTAQLLSSLDALFFSLTKYADLAGTDTIQISKLRAKELLKQISIARAEVKKPKRDPAYFSRLDKIMS